MEGSDLKKDLNDLWRVWNEVKVGGMILKGDGSFLNDLKMRDYFWRGKDFFLRGGGTI